MAYKTLPVKVSAVAPWVNSSISPNYNQGIVILGDATGAAVTDGFLCAGSGVTGATHFMPNAYPGPEFQVFAGGDNFAVTHGSGFAGDISHIETEQQLSLCVVAAGFFSNFFKRPKPTFGYPVPFDTTIGGTSVRLDGKRLYGQPSFKEAADACCGDWASSALYRPREAQGEFPAVWIPVEPAKMGGGTTRTVQVLFSYVGSRYEVYDYAWREPAMTAAKAARESYATTLSQQLNRVSLGQVPNITGLQTRPVATISGELHPDDRAALDTWWNDCVKQVTTLGQVTTPASADPTLAAKYAARGAEDQKLSFDDWFVKTQRGGVTAPVATPTEGESWWESALSSLGSAASSAIGWAGNSVVDLAKSWGPLGTAATVGLATGMFGKWGPWLLAGAVALVLLK